MSDFEITPMGCSTLSGDSITGSPLIPSFIIIFAASAKSASFSIVIVFRIIISSIRTKDSSIKSGFDLEHLLTLVQKTNHTKILGLRQRSIARIWNNTQDSKIVDASYISLTDIMRNHNQVLLDYISNGYYNNYLDEDVNTKSQQNNHRLSYYGIATY
jgi:hypothetical protein